ncbi:galactose-specific lectin nattectin [Nematolebias whitei]|uniref:galactose-specific lectin nattectin n=1 Tax=Nematolebias whitei TaxID=451745 RepID=UPI001896F323|nr:galactose-specific lectin nattectin [Nematolebias whitei]
MSSGLLFMLLCGLGIGGNILCDAGCSNCQICPPSWTLYQSRCFLFKSTEMTWGDAEAYCTDQDGHLASFRDEAEYYFIRGLIVKDSGTNTKSWVGGTKGQDGDWTWSDGSQITYTHWGPGEPNNMGGHENCMDMNWNGEDYVNDEVCDQLNAFICYKDA